MPSHVWRTGVVPPESGLKLWDGWSSRTKYWQYKIPWCLWCRSNRQLPGNYTTGPRCHSPLTRCLLAMAVIQEQLSSARQNSKRNSKSLKTKRKVTCLNDDSNPLSWSILSIARRCKSLGILAIQLARWSIRLPLSWWTTLAVRVGVCLT